MLELPVRDPARLEVLAYDCARDDAHVLDADAKTVELLGDDGSVRNLKFTALGPLLRVERLAG